MGVGVGGGGALYHSHGAVGGRDGECGGGGDSRGESTPFRTHLAGPVMAFETDLLEYADILDGSPVIAAKVKELIEGAKAEIANVEAQGGIIAAIESGYVKRELVASHMNRLRAIESGDLKIIGVNCFKETAESPLTMGGDGSIMKTNPAAEREQIERLQAHRKNRNDADVRAALQGLADAAKSDENIMPSSIRCALAGVTTGEWGDSLRAVFGEFRPPTGIDIAIDSREVLGKKDQVTELRARAANTGKALGRPLKLLVGKPGLDGHCNGAEQVAVKARDVGFEVGYDGIRLTPQQIAQAALEVAAVRALGEVEAGILDRRPDAVLVEGVVHHRVADAVAATDTAGIADDDDLRLVELDARGARGHRREQLAVVHDVGIGRHLDLAEGDGDAERGAAVGQVHRLVRVLGPHPVSAGLGIADRVNGQQRGLGLYVMHMLGAVSYTHLRAHETVLDLVCRLLLENKTKYHHDSNSNSLTTCTLVNHSVC